MNKVPRVGFIGLGRMGLPIARNILKGGFPLVVWNRNKDKAKGLVEMGAHLAATPKELAERSDVIISMLTESWVTESVLLGREEFVGSAVLDGLNEGKIVIDMSTNHPAVVKGLAAHVKSKGGIFLDAPVMGGPFIAEQGKLTVLAAGDREAVERVSPVFKSMSERVLYVGDVGSGMTIKLVLNLYLWIIMAAYAECVVMASKLGVDCKKLTEIFNNTVLKNYISEFKAKKIIDDEWSPAATMDIAAKDLKLAMEIAKDVEIPLPLGSTTRDLYVAACNQGLKDLDVMAIAILYGRLANAKISRNV